MRKDVFVFVVLVAYPAFSQVSSGTVLVFNFAKDKVIVAADSRGLGDTGGPPDDSYCKISAFSNKFVFATVGNARYTRGFIDSIESWDNGNLAGDAFRTTPKNATGDDDMTAISNNWAQAVMQKWAPLCQANLLRCKSLTEASGGVLTGGVFFRAKGLLQSVAAISFNFDTFNPGLSYVTSKTTANCWPCGKKHGQVCALGSHVDVAAKFCSERKHGSRIHVRIPLKDADIETRLAVRIAEMTIDAYNSEADNVGGKVDSITLTKNGGITWNSRKDNCPANQD